MPFGTDLSVALHCHLFPLFSFQGAIPDTLRYQISRLNPLNPEIQCQIDILVGPSGLEPPTLRLSVVRSSQLSYGPICGGDKRDRTADLLNAIQALSQLSYTPIFGLLFCDSFAIIATKR